MVPCIRSPSATQEKLLQRLDPNALDPGFRSWNDFGPMRKVRRPSAGSPAPAVGISHARIQKPEAPGPPSAPEPCGDPVAARPESSKAVSIIGRIPPIESLRERAGRKGQRVPPSMLSQANRPQSGETLGCIGRRADGFAATGRPATTGSGHPIRRSGNMNAKRRRRCPTRSPDGPPRRSRLTAPGGSASLVGPWRAAIADPAGSQRRTSRRMRI